MRRALSLAKETLTELATEDLASVVGGYPTQQSIVECLLQTQLDCLTGNYLTLPLEACVTR